MASNLISTGFVRNPVPADRIARHVAVGALAFAGAFLVPQASAQQPKLLEPERAFAFSVQPLDEKTVEARFTIANGYYLYREKMKFAVEPGALREAAVLPPGKVKHDEFFGDVETYRGQVAVKLAIDPKDTAAGRTITVVAESQGCADVGVCYPPQAQRIKVPLPLPGQGPGAPVAATPAKKSWFN